MIRHFCIYVVRTYVVLFYGHKVYGKKNLPKSGGIVAANHSSYLDPPIVGVSCPHEVHFLGRATLFKSKLFAWLIKKLLTHPVAPGKGNIATIRKCIELIKAGKKVVIFPEGKRSPDGEIHKGQPGVGMLVMRTKCAVIPVYIHGTFDIWGKDRSLPSFKGKTACVFGTPLYLTHIYEDKEKKGAEEEIADEIMKAIVKLKKWYLDGAKGPIP